MSAKSRQFGLTLPEMVVVIAIIALLVGVGLPAVRMVQSSFESGSSAKSVISTALATARALAAKENHYVGVRFQTAYNPDAADPLNPLTAPQYMIFIVHDSQIRANGFRVIEGTKPIKLPDSIRVKSPDDTTFSIVFSPSGKLIIHNVRVMNKDGVMDDSSEDDVFNTWEKITHTGNPRGMFVQDSGDRLSRNSFVLYDKIQTDKLEIVYINPHTGTIISTD